MKTIGLAVLSLVIIVTSALTASRIADKSSKQTIVSRVLSMSSSSKEFVSVPVLSTQQAFPALSAQSALAVDLDSGVSMYEKNPDLPLLPASTTKIITALVAMDYYPLNRIITVGVVNHVGTDIGLEKGEQISVDALIHALLISSANDAAQVLADNYPGGNGAFVLAMNEKAKELNLENSVFKNPSGLEAEGHISTARDLIRVAEIAMRNPYFASIVGTRETQVESVDGRFVHKLVNINELLGEVDGVLGVKTGWTENARENLVTYIVRDDHRVMIALMGSRDRFGETKLLINWLYENYHWEDVNYSDASFP